MRSWLANKRFWRMIIGICLIGIMMFFVIQSAFDGRKYDVKSDTLGVYNSLLDCINGTQTNICLKSEALFYLKKFSLAQILDALDGFERNNIDIQGYIDCHAFTHFLGKESYRKEKSIPKVYKYCTMVCGGGCYHGAVEEYLKENPKMISDFDSIGQNSFTTLCDNEKDYGKLGLYVQCLHGLGHAFMGVSENDVPRSLTLCDMIHNLYTPFCYTGVFMENAVSTTSLHPTNFLKADDPLYPCDAVEEKYKRTCYTFQGAYFVKKTNSNWSAAAQLCRLVPMPYRYDCFATIGANQVYIKQDATQIKKNCDLISEDAFRNECVKGVVNAFAGRYGEESKMLMKKFCALVDAGYQESCYRQAGKALAYCVEKGNQVGSVCDIFLDEKMHSWCMLGTQD